MATTGNQWPNLSPATSDALSQLMRGQVPDPNRFFVRPANFFHRIAYPQAGTASPLVFFNVAATPFVTNMPQASQLATESALLLTSIRVTLETGLALDGSRVAAHSLFLTTSAGATATIAEEVRTIMNAGYVTLKIGDRIIDGYSLTRFPSAAGVDGFGALCGTNASPGGGVNATNGTPVAGNEYRLSVPLPVLPGKSIVGNVTFQSALSVTSAATVIRMELGGQLLSAQSI